MSMNAVQSLMLALTFHHQISDGSVSLPEPTYQADEWAKRGKNMWNAYMFRHEPIKMDCCGDYALPPIDFDAMTDRLAFWKTELEHLRVNA
ncbi:Worm-specific Argonaute WAGO-new2 [Trichostrongylus colubriformis]|uniref:Worm-specific Argonaute WAGO-new2 n=1 Tax=Trichostrongylus colubriformis TaxID=6319 RepID=A0AAN8EVB6_TRICO